VRVRVRVPPYSGSAIHQRRRGLFSGPVAAPNSRQRAKSLVPPSAGGDQPWSILQVGLRLNASEEDCLRQVFTYGRGGQAGSDAAALPDTFNVQSGDQVDVRVSTTGHAPAVLWVRARFTDDRSGWALHDYRRLRPTQPCKV
jgi:hypothetical protein